MANLGSPLRGKGEWRRESGEGGWERGGKGEVSCERDARTGTKYPSLGRPTALAFEFGLNVWGASCQIALASEERVSRCGRYSRWIGHGGYDNGELPRGQFPPAPPPPPIGYCITPVRSLCSWRFVLRRQKKKKKKRGTAGTAPVIPPPPPSFLTTQNRGQSGAS